MEHNNLTYEEIEINNREYWKLWASKSIVERLVYGIHYQDEDLLVFLDETGNESKSPIEEENLFGISGAAFVGRDYRSFGNEWSRLKHGLFNVKAGQGFHAKKHLKKFCRRAPHKVPELSSVMRNWRMFPLTRFYDFRQTFPNKSDYARVSVRSVISDFDLELSISFGKPVRRDMWIFEQSEKINWLTVSNDLQPAYPFAREHLGTVFMKKEALEPGLEMADLIAYVSSSFQARLMGKSSHLGLSGQQSSALHEAIFNRRP